MSHMVNDQLRDEQSCVRRCDRVFSGRRGQLGPWVGGFERFTVLLAVMHSGPWMMLEHILVEGAASDVNMFLSDIKHLREANMSCYTGFL